MYEIRPSGHVPDPFRRRFAFPAVGLGLTLFFGLVVMTPLHVFPLFPLLWVLPFLAVRALGITPGRSRSRTPGGRSGEDREERELLEALERRGRITAARAALETSLSVAQADRRLSRLAENGHLRVDAQEVSLAYSLWDADRRQAREARAHPGEIVDGP